MSYEPKAMSKTSKTFAKRVKVTKKGKIIVRKPGQNHFNAKESRKRQLAKKRAATLNISKKQLANIYR